MRPAVRPPPVARRYTNIVIDMYDTKGSNWLRYVNSCVNTGKEANVCARWRGPLMEIWTCKEISAGEELLLEYNLK